jgi:hypothetical protein
MEAVDPAELVPGLADYATGLKVPSLWIVHNDKGEHPFWGATDYTPTLQALQDVLNYVLALISRHADALTVGGHLVMPLEMQAEIQNLSPTNSQGSSDFGRRNYGAGALPSVKLKALEVIYEHSGNAGVTRYISRAPAVDAILRVVELYLGLFERSAGITFDRLWDAVAPESGRALRLMRQRDALRIARKCVRLTEPLEDALAAALQMDAGIAEDVSIGWQDPFPLTDTDRAELLAIRTGNKPTLSRLTGLQAFGGMTEDDAAEEVARLEAEEKMAGMDRPAFGAGGMSFPASEEGAEEQTTERPAEEEAKA